MNKRLQLTLLLAVGAVSLTACIVEPYHRRDYYRPAPVFVPPPPPPPGYYRSY